MKKKYLGVLAAFAGMAAAWSIYRNKKYPIRLELRFVNKFAVPGCVLTEKTARLANRSLAHMSTPAPPSGVVRQEVQIPSEDGAQIRLTLYRPEGVAGEIPCLVYFHGGGFCLGDAGYIHGYAARYAKESRCMVVFVHYRTSDIAPFPIPFQDCYDSLCWVWSRAEELGVDRKHIAVGGDSAGGAIAAACTLRARDENGPRLCFQLLIYPVTDSRMITPSMRKYTDSPLWNAHLNRRMWEMYLREGDGGMPEYAAPMLASDFSGLPPAYVEVEEFDCLHDEGVAYAEALKEAGVSMKLEEVKGTFHGFDVLTDKSVSQRMVWKRINALQLAWFRQRSSI